MDYKTNWRLITLIITVCKVISANSEEGIASLLSTLCVGVCVWVEEVSGSPNLDHFMPSQGQRRPGPFCQVLGKRQGRWRRQLRFPSASSIGHSEHNS